MMPELSLNILDIAQNSVAAGASLIEISIRINTPADKLEITVLDNGCGMTPEQAARVTDPFYTTRTTRRVGLGVPFLKMAAEMTGGNLRIDSTPGAGTAVTAVFGLSHIDRMPLGGIADTFCALAGPNPDRDFVLALTIDGRSFTADTRDFKKELEDVPLSDPEVLVFIRQYIEEHLAALGNID